MSVALKWKDVSKSKLVSYTLPLYLQTLFVGVYTWISVCIYTHTNTHAYVYIGLFYYQIYMTEK